MAYTYDQLVLAYTAVHDGIGPGAATQANFQIQEMLSANGQLTDAQLLSNIVNSADNSTGLAVLAYQFFTGKSPTKAGIDYLVNSTVNTKDLNDPYYSKFSLENRYINFAANLGIQGEGAANFATKYGALSFSDYVASIYQTIVGASYATASGIDPAKAIADIISRKDAILATATSAGMISANATAAQIDIALKAATAGYLLGEAIKADVGIYAAANNNFMVALIQGTATYNTVITQTYQPAISTPAHGTGHALDNAPPNLPVQTPPTVPADPAAPQLVLSAGADHITGAATDETFTATGATLSAGDSLNGGGGNDILTITATGSFVVPAVTVSNVETVNINGASGLTADISTWTGVNTLNTTSVGGAADTTIAANVTTNINATVTSQGDNAVAINDGHNITLVATGVTGAGTIYAASTATDSTINITRTATNAGNTDSITAEGGQTIKITQINGNDVNTTQGNSRVHVNGGDHTTSVELIAPVEATADAGTAGVTAEAAYIIDSNTNNGAGLGTLTTVKVDSYIYVNIIDNALTSLTLAHNHPTSGDIDIDNSFASVGRATTLNLNLNAVTSGVLGDAGVYTTLNVTTGATASTLDDLVMTGLTTLNVSGATNLTLTSTSHATALHTATVTGAASLTATFGAGADTISLGAGASTINTGAGADVVNITAANAASTTVFSTLTVSAGDKVGITAQGGAAAFTGVMGAMTAFNTDFATTLNDAAAGDGHTTSHWSYFQFGGNTYVVLDNSASATFQAGTDIVVKLVGALTEAGATITAGVLTIQ